MKYFDSKMDRFSLCRLLVEREHEIDVLNREVKACREENCRLHGIISRLKEEKKKKRGHKISARQKAKEAGAVYGRPKMAIPESFDSIAEKFERKQMSAKMAADELKVSTTTFYRWLHERNGKTE